MPEPSKKYPLTRAQIESNKVFIVHGRDDLPKEELARILIEMGLKPIILHERPNRGRTLIEKFEDECSDIGYAFVIMTPDDVGCLKNDYIDKFFLSKDPKKIEKVTVALHERNKFFPFKYRARQNVILELGFFFGKLGRGRVCCLFKRNDIEKPTDLDGIVYISFTERIGEIYRDIVKELRSAGYEPKT